MSRDSSATYIHLHHPRLADVFEDFNRPHSSLFTNQQAENQSNNATDAATLIPGATPDNMIPSFLPIEDIFVAPQFQPVNPEDEDDVVPDQHAAFGITRAMDSRRQIVWRDLGIEELMSGVRVNGEPREDATGAGGAGTAAGSGTRVIGWGAVGLSVGGLRGTTAAALPGSAARRRRKMVCLR
ncbi:hypothetical protein FQN57_006401 [Myotisia sp. PD_48]|nr:hypothetical protein FQN57_006401 [Myotisia sp. PD_48]